MEKQKIPEIYERFQAAIQNQLHAITKLLPGSKYWWEQLKEPMSAVGKAILRYCKSIKEELISERTLGVIQE